MRRLITSTIFFVCSGTLFAQVGGAGGDRVCPGEGRRGPPPTYPGPEDIRPGAPAPSAPTTPAAAPSAPTGAATPAPTPGSTYEPPTLTGYSMPWDDPSSWRHWWVLNREPYLGLKTIASQADVLTGSDDFFLGHGRTREGREIELVDDDTFFKTVVPALAQLLEKERDGSLRAISLIALAEGGAGRPGAETLVEHILPFLASGRVEVAEAATAALGILGQPEAVPVLTNLLHCYSRDLASELELNFGAHIAPRQRAFAAYALGLLGRQADGYWKMRIANTLAEAVMRDQHSSHELRAAGIVALGLVPLPVTAEDPVDQRRTVLTSRQEQVRWLLGALDESAFDPRVRAQVPVSIARLLEDAPASFTLRELAVRRIVTLMGDRAGEQIPVRRGCAQALGWLVDCDEGKLDTLVREALVEAGKDASDQGVRRFAWIALGRAAGRAGTEGDRLAGLKAARAALGSELASGGTPMRPWAALAIGVLERSLLDGGNSASDDMRKSLQRALADARTLEEVGACAIGIGLTRDGQAGELLRKEFASTRDPETRGDLALALGMIEDRAAIDTLRTTCAGSTNQPQLLLHLAMGLALLGDKGIGAQLEELLDETASSSPAIHLLAALGRVGASHTVERLVTAGLDDQQPSAARSAAIGALGRVVELDLLPWTSRLSVGSTYRSGAVTLTTVPRGDGVLDLRP